jgi:antitoxin component of RelBE/YafQ-DinJ toxin-antitoxin module
MTDVEEPPSPVTMALLDKTTRAVLKRYVEDVRPAEVRKRGLVLTTFWCDPTPQGCEKPLAVQSIYVPDREVLSGEHRLARRALQARPNLRHDLAHYDPKKEFLIVAILAVDPSLNLTEAQAEAMGLAQVIQSGRVPFEALHSFDSTMLEGVREMLDAAKEASTATADPSRLTT